MTTSLPAIDRHALEAFLKEMGQIRGQAAGAATKTTTTEAAAAKAHKDACLQAAELVMDYGIPRTGDDLLTLYQRLIALGNQPGAAQK